MTAGITPEQDRWLRDHRWGLLTTLRADGRPQTTMVAYHWDGRDAVVSCRSTAAKWHNVARRPDVSLTVAQDRSYLTVNGEAVGVAADPGRAELTDRVLHSLLPADRALLQADIDRGLDRSRRVVIVVQPRAVLGRL